jgi:hypothetical protein
MNVKKIDLFTGTANIELANEVASILGTVVAPA